LHPALARDWEQARPRLEELRNIILGFHFSSDEIDTALKLIADDGIGIDSAKVKPGERALISRLAPWIVDTIALEPPQ
jgi:hypothetical protein